MNYHQVSQLPYQSFDEIQKHYAHLTQSEERWDELLVLADEQCFNSVFILQMSGEILSSFRANVTPENAWKVVSLFSDSGIKTNVAWLEDEITIEQLSSVDELRETVEKSRKERLKKTDLKRLFAEAEKGKKKKVGRGDGFTVKTARKVFDDSSMRCMFEGCAARLDQNNLTGDDAYFGYLAHIVASSEQGPRGEVGLSAKLSNEPSNVMLLCDTCHRLIDRVACADFPASRLNAMRKRFVEDKNALLDLLAHRPVDTYTLIWPVNGQVISPPSLKEINGCLAVSGFRSNGNPQIVEDSNNSSFRDDKSVDFWQTMPRSLRAACQRIEQSSQSSGHTFGLFAMGPMATLVGLGALIGNKNNAIPMLRFRDSEQWTWPRETPLPPNLKVQIPDKMPGDAAVVSVCLTSSPPSFEIVSKEICQKLSCSKVTVSVESPSNGCLGNPNELKTFQSKMNSLLHKLACEHGIKEVHLLVCASNAACISFGRSVEQYHPRVIVYDFDGDGVLQPRLEISPGDEGPQVGFPAA